MSFYWKSAILSVMVASSIAPASAAVISFNLTGSRSASFSIDSNTAPSSSTAFQSQFNNVAGIFNGALGVAPSVSFGLSSLVSDFQITGTSLGFTQFAGPIVITGTTAAPVFTPGTYSLTSIVSGASTLVITAMDSPGGPMTGPGGATGVPEPASAALMLAGVAGVAASRRRGRAG